MGSAHSEAPPPASSNRIVTLDALRGFAVAGIAIVNVMVFAMVPAAYYNPALSAQDPSALDLAVWAVSFLLIEDKFRTLFAIMFGVGIAILWERSGPHRWHAHLARMAVLLAIGMVHSIVLASNDILRAYALAGVFVPLFLRLPVRGLLMVAGALMAAQLAIAGWFALDWLRYWYGLPPGDGAGLAAVGERFGDSVAARREGLAILNEGFGERVGRRIHAWQAALTTAFAALPSTLAAALTGIALLRAGLLTGEVAPRRALRLAAWLGLPSLAVLGILLAWNFASGLSAIVVASTALVWSAPFDFLLGIAFAALFMALARPGGALVRLLADAGRLALTNYLATSLVFAALFASWGLGLGGEVSRAAATALAIVPVALMLLWSPAWRRHFGQGPAERAWRSASAALQRISLFSTSRPAR